MFFKSSIIALFSFFLLAGCKTQINYLTLSTCKAIETKSKKCSELVSQELSLIDTNQSAISEREIILD